MAAKQPTRDINPQMEKFCQAYIKDQNMDGPAATAAGYKQPTVKASKLLADPRIQKRIADLMRQRNCKYPSFSSTHFLRVPVFQPSAGILPASGCSGIHEAARCYIPSASAL